MLEGALIALAGILNGRYVRCTCRQYSGPTPLPEVFAPQIGGSA
jgi:hypothetical protein